MANQLENIQRVLISRTDSIGDVALTLPMCVWIKQRFPEVELIYLGRAYTKPIITKFAAVHSFEDWSILETLETKQQVAYLKNLHIDLIIHVFPNKKVAHLAKAAKIPTRIGTSHRSFHWFTCNKLINFSRKKSHLHEAELNFELLKPLGLKNIPGLREINEWITNQLLTSGIDLPKEIQGLIKNEKKRVILHPKSQGSAMEWPVEKFFELALNLAKKDYQVYFSGTESEGLQFRKDIPHHENIFDLTGRLSLDEFMTFIQKAQVLVACSTGPLHIAGLYNTHAIGLFSPRKPIHPGRWKPLGNHVSILVYDANCPHCKAGKQCHCISDISVSEVERLIS